MRFAWFVLLVGCGTTENVLDARKLPADIAGDASAVVAANNQFALDVYGKLPAGNAIFSPFSISTAFAMLDAGAATDTDSQLRSTLHFTLPGDRLHAAYGALLHSLDTGRGFGAYTLATADRLFGQQGLAFEQPFLDTTKTDYGAQLQPEDFAADPDGSRAQINDWVASQTDNKITQLFPAGSIDPSTRLVLANAILFKGSWDHQFDPKRTAAGSFHVAGGADVTAQLMTANIPVGFAPITGGRIGVLPFEGKDLEFVVVLPDDPDGLPALEAQLGGPTGLAQVLAEGVAIDDSSPQPVTLPKFSFHIGFGLVPVMQALGVTDAFDPTLADFSGIDGARDLFVESALHDAMITVDEQGAEAAAATGIGVGASGEPEGLIADHSFAFAIYDTVTGSVLFLGRCADPTGTN